MGNRGSRTAKGGPTTDSKNAAKDNALNNSLDAIRYRIIPDHLEKEKQYQSQSLFLLMM